MSSSPDGQGLGKYIITLIFILNLIFKTHGSSSTIKNYMLHCFTPPPPNPQKMSEHSFGCVQFLGISFYFNDWFIMIDLIFNFSLI